MRVADPTRGLRGAAPSSVVLGATLAVVLAACGARGPLAVDAPASDEPGVADAASDAGPDAGPDAGIDGSDAGEPECAWGPGMVGVQRARGDEPDAQLPMLFHVDPTGRVRSTILDSRSGGAFGMGVAVREGVVGASWRVRRDDGSNALYFARVIDGCPIGSPSIVHETDTLQAFRGNLVATSLGWMVLWIAERGLEARVLDADGGAVGPPVSIAAIDDARFSVAAQGDRIGVLYVQGGVRLIELTPDGALVAAIVVAGGASLLEPRLVALEGAWGGTYLAGGEIVAFDVGATGVVTEVSLGEACTACVSEPSYLLPAAAAAGRRVGALWPVSRAGGVELSFAIAAPASGSVELSAVLARGALGWPALGFDGARFVAVYDESSLVNVSFLQPSSLERAPASAPGGFQRVPSLAAVP